MNNHHDYAKKILVVDDTPANLEVMLDVLSSAGYVVATTASGERTLKHLETEHPDLILLDIHMPQMDGFETCRQIKSNIDTADIPIIFITAFSDTEKIAQGFELGAVDYISKPVQKTELLARVRTHIRLSSLTQNLEQQVLERTAALKTLEARQRKLFETSPMGLVLCRMDGSLADINPAYAAILGRTVPETLTLTNGEITPDTYATQDQVQLETLEKTGQYGPYEKEYIHKEGHCVPVRLSGILLNQDGETFIWSSVEDISDRKQAEQLLTDYNDELERQVEERTRALRQSQSELTDYVENAATSLHWVDADGIIVWANQTELDFMGYGREEYIGQSIAQFHADEDVIADILTRLSNNETLVNYEARLRCKDGSIRYVQINSNVFYRDGEFVHTRCFTTDITGRKIAETALSDLVEGTAATIGEEFFPALVQHISTALDVPIALITQFIDQELQSLALVIDGELQPNFTYALTNIPCHELTKGEDFYYCSRNLSTHFPNIPHQITGMESYLGVALRDRQGQLLGSLCILDRHPLPYSEQAQQILKIFGSRAAAEIERLRTQTALEELNQELEQRVEIRTQELARSEQDLRTIFNNVYDAIFIHDLDGAILDINEQVVDLFGVPREQILAASIADISAPDAPIDQVPDLFQQVWSGKKLWFEWKDRRLSDGVTFDVEVSLKKVILGNRPVIVAGVREIGDRKQAENALQEEKLRLQLALSAAQLGTWSYSLQTGKVVRSERAQEIFGFEQGSLPCDRDTFAAMIHPDDADRVMAAIDTSIETGILYQIEYRIRRLDGGVRWIADWGQLFSPMTAIDSQLVGVVADISDRKAAEEKLRASEQRLRRAIDTAPFPIMIHAEDGEVLQISSTWTELTGYSHAEIPTVTAWAKRAYGEQAANLFQEIMAHKYDITSRWEEGEFTVCTKDGKKCIWQFSSAPLGRLPDGRRSIISMAVDITMQRQVEKHLGRANQKLEEYSHTLEQKVEERTAALQVAKAQVEKAKEYEQALNHIIKDIRQSLNLNQIFSSTTQKVRLVLDCERVAIYKFNPDYSGSFIFESALIGLPKLATSSHPSEWSDSYLQEHKGGKYQHNHITVVDDISKQSYSSCYLEILESFQIKSYLVGPIFVGKQLWGLLAAYHHLRPRTWQLADINLFQQVTTHLGVALKQSELLEEMTLAKEKADSANQSKSTFLANMSHELRTPLNGILGYAQILERSPGLSKRDYEGLRTIHKCGNHLLNLINDILDFSKIEAHKLELVNTIVNLPTLLESVVEMCQVRAVQKGITLIYQLGSNLPRDVLVDETRLRQVLINLLNNAIKFTQIGSVTLEVEMITAPGHHPDNDKNRSAYLSFRIIDTGIGIASSDFKKLFEAFERVGDRHYQTIGSGLGLSISQRIIQMMGGQIEVISELGQGSTFFFNLWLEQSMSHPSGHSNVVTPNLLFPSGYSGDRQSILVADDNKSNRDVIHHLLAPLGFTILEAENGEEGLEKCLQDCPDLIIADLTMPIMDGYDMIQNIRANEALKATRIIASSASVELETQQKAIYVGANTFLAKPIQSESLLQQIAEYLDLSWIMNSEVQAGVDHDHPINAAAAADAICPLLPSEEILHSMLDLTKRGRIRNLCHLLDDLMAEDENYAPFAQPLLDLSHQFQLSAIEVNLTEYLENL